MKNFFFEVLLFLSWLISSFWFPLFISVLVGYCLFSFTTDLDVVVDALGSTEAVFNFLLCESVEHDVIKIDCSAFDHLK